MAKRETDPWREHKRTRKDKAKPGYPMSSMTTRVHTWYKVYVRRKERSWVRQKITRGDWDNWLNFPLDYHEDPWGWD